MASRKVSAGALLWFALGLVSCGLGEASLAGAAAPRGADSAWPDAGPDAGAPEELDAGAPEEFDAGAPVRDAGVDAGVPREAGLAMDAGAAPDGGLAVGVPGDGGPGVDAGRAGGGFPSDGGSGLWVTGYYPGWTRASLRPTDIDYAALTHLVDFSLHPRPDGTLEDAQPILPTSAATIAAAHAGGVQVLVCIGGTNTAAGFRGATAPAQLPLFVDNLVALVTRSGYDGIDLDWEPLATSDQPQYVALVRALQPRLAALTPPRVLTAAVDSWAANIIAPVADRFDQVNLMTYDQAGNSADWVSWFNSPLVGGGAPRPSGKVLPSADLSVDRYLAAGIAAPRLGIGIAFYGNLWSGGAGTSTGGVTAPRQSWTTSPTLVAIDYRTIMGTWYQPGRYHLDPSTGSAWLGIDQAGSASDHFITYDDETTIALKLLWAKTHGLGGVILWQLGGAWFPTAPAGQRAPLLDAVRLHR